MNSQSKELQKVYQAFPQAFINQQNELIIHPRRNTFFRLDDVNNETELACKILEWLTHESIRSSSPASRKYHRDGIRKYFGIDFDENDLELIYRYVGNGTNRELCVKLIENDFDILVLEEE